MKLTLKNEAEMPIASDLADDKLLGFYSPSENFIIHIFDLDETCKDWMEDLSQVEKFTMSDEAYDKLEDSMRAFKKRMGITKVTKKESSTDSIDIKVDINVGDRCQVDPGEKRGTVQFVGPISQLKPGIWVGICYDEPLGKNDGSLNGVKYFSCEANYGSFVRPTVVRVGDFPPLDEFPDEL
eukprot:g686.t1